MNHLIKLVLFMLLGVTTVSTQSISGVVLDSKSNPLYYSNAILYSDAGIFIEGTTADENGAFTFTGIESGKYYLEASYLGFETSKSDTVLVGSLGDVTNVSIILTEASEMLNTIVVEGRRPLLEQRADKLIVNVADNLTSLNSSVLDVMKKVPGMMVVNDQLRMAGQPNVTILIDGKTTQYMDMSSLLRDMPGDNIKKIEIIQQPGAEYDASGSGAIINIVLKKNSLLGTNGTAYVGVGQSYKTFYNTGASFSSYQNALNIQGGLGYSHGAYYDELQISREVGDVTYDQITKDPIDPESMRGNVSLDWDIDDRQRLGVATKLTKSVTNKIADNTTQLRQGDMDLFTLETDNEADRSWSLFSINPYYKFDIDTNGQKLDLDFNYATFKRNSNNELQSQNITTNAMLDGQDINQIGDTKILAAEANYKYPVNNQLRLLTGLKYSSADLDNDLVSRTQNEEGIWEINEGQSNHYLFDETISAAYIKAEFEKGTWTGTAGLRYEQSLSEGYSITSDTSFTRDIKKLFPSFSIGKSITKDLNLSFAYSYRIDRPSYASLNPFVYYYDPYTYEQGNPSLRPELTHSMKMSLAYQGQPFFNVEYKLTDDAMIEVTEQNDVTGETSRLTVNLAQNTNFNTSLFFPLDFIPGISGYAGAIVNYREIDSRYLDQDFYRSLWSVTNVIGVNFTLPGEINTEISGWHNTGSLEGIIRGGWLYGVSFGLSKKIMDGKGKISVGMEDAFNRFWHGRINYANMNADLVSRWQTKVVNAKFSYKFGNASLKSKSKNRGSASDVMNRIDTK